MATRLTDAQWDSIRSIWEYSPDEVTHAVAAERAAQKHGFTPPTKQAVQKRANKDGWQRKASLAGINQAAHRIADKLVKSDGSKEEPKEKVVDGKGDNGPEVVGDNRKKPPVDTAKAEQEERAESERKRAEVRARHRTEWTQVAALRQEALAKRAAQPGEAFDRLKIAKITAEITAIQQQGECRAWGLNELLDPSRLRGLSDDQLEALAQGKSI